MKWGVPPKKPLIMKRFSSVILLMFFSSSFGSAQTISGKIIDANDKQALPYINIGIIGKGIGTVSDIDGKFTLNLHDSLNSQTLKFSCIGYKSQSFIVREFRKKLNDNSILISLDQNTFTLSQVVVKPKLLKTKVLGNKNNNKSAMAGFKSNDLGSEMGTIMKIKKAPTHIENVNFNIAKNEITNLKFRVNIYSMKNGQPDSILLKEPIYVTTSITSGTLSVDMKKYNIWIDTDFFVSLEWIEDFGPNKLYFCVGLMDSNSMWRKTSQDKWQKATPVGIGFNSTVTYEK